MPAERCRRLVEGGGSVSPTGGAAPASQRWEPLPATPRLAWGEVHVVRAWLDRPSGGLARLRGLLRVSELERAERLRRVKDSRRTVASRGILRVLLGRYLERDPASVELITTKYGKPLLREEENEQFLHFNVSHCGAQALYAFTRIGPVGVDVEAVRDSGDLDALAAGLFSPWESKELSAVDPELRPLAFFHCWTRKEALLKATGEGLLRDLSDFDVSLRPGQEARLLAWRSGNRRCEEWTLRSLVPFPSYVGALAVHGIVDRLRFRVWT